MPCHFYTIILPNYILYQTQWNSFVQEGRKWRAINCKQSISLSPERTKGNPHYLYYMCTEHFECHIRHKLGWFYKISVWYRSPMIELWYTMRIIVPLRILNPTSPCRRRWIFLHRFLPFHVHVSTGEIFCPYISIRPIHYFTNMHKISRRSLIPTVCTPGSGFRQRQQKT